MPIWPIIWEMFRKERASVDFALFKPMSWA
jgi:hypothetical protein